MSIFCSGLVLDVDEDHGPPLIYQGSHVMPTADSPRGGTLDVGYIPGLIEHDGRDRAGDARPDGSDDEGVWPWLRLSVAPVQPAAERRRRSRRARAYRWVLRAHLRLGVRLPSWASWPADTVILDRDQVAALRDELTDWLHRCDDPDGWLDARMGQGSGGGAG